MIVSFSVTRNKEFKVIVLNHVALNVAQIHGSFVTEHETAQYRAFIFNIWSVVLRVLHELEITVSSHSDA